MNKPLNERSNGVYETDELVALRQQLAALEAAYEQLQTAHQHASQQLELYQYIVENIPVGLHVYHMDVPDDDHTLRMVVTNPAATKLSGVPMADVLGKTLDESFPGLREQGVPQAYARVVQTGEPLEFENVYSDNRVVQRALAIRAVALPGGYVSVMFEDIIERKQAEEDLRYLNAELEQHIIERTAELHHHQTLLQGILDHSPLGIYVKDLHGTYLLVNRYFAATLNSTPEQIVGQHEQALFTPEVVAAWCPIDQDIITTGKPVSREDTLCYYDGSRTYVMVNFPIYDDAGQVYAIAGIATDITERKRAEEEVQRSYTYLHNIINALDDPLFVKDAQHRLTMVNDALCRFVGHPRDVLLVSSDYDLFPPEQADVFWEKDDIVFCTGLPNENEELLTDAEGKTHIVSTKKSVFIHNNTPVLVGTVRDITERRQAEESLRQQQELIQGLLDHSKTIILVKDQAGRYVMMNNYYCETILGRSKHDVIGRTLADIYPPEVAVPLMEQDDLVLTTGQTSQHEDLLPGKDGSHIFLTIKFPLYDKQGSINGLGAIGTEITERKRAEEALRASETRFRLLFEQSPDAICIEALDGTILAANPAACALYRLSCVDLVGKNILSGDLSSPEEMPIITRDFLDQVAGALPRCESMLTASDGQKIPVEVHSSRILYDNIPALLVHIRDISQRKAYEAQIEHLAFTDQLTELPNRRWLYHVGDATLTAMQSAMGMVALLYLDLNRFKAVNDTLGHDVGDELLVQVAARLRSCVRPGDTLARLGGDEFAVLLPQCDSLHARQVAERILAALAQPFDLRDQVVHLEGSIGIAVRNLAGIPFSLLLTQADIAMYRAKALGGGVQVYDPALSPILVDQLQLETELRWALANDTLTLFYQPIMDLSTNQVMGAEALVRWEHPTRGRLPPDMFLPLAEEAGLLGTLDHWVIKTAIAQAAAWNAAGQSLVVSINLTAQSIQRTNLVDEVEGLLTMYNLPANRIIIELTEHTALRDMTASRYVLRGLQSLGLRIALDDFGMGYASLTHLRQLPIDLMKIDRSFAVGIGHDRKDEAVVRALLAMGHALGLLVIAEGVEQTEQLEWLRSIQCPLVQGYLIGRPMPPGEVSALESILAL